MCGQATNRKKKKTLPEVDISCVNLSSMNLGTCIMLMYFFKEIKEENT